MNTAARVFHQAPRPISSSEFKDAVDAVCRPRFPTARFARPQRIGKLSQHLFASQDIDIHQLWQSAEV